LLALAVALLAPTRTSAQTDRAPKALYSTPAGQIPVLYFAATCGRYGRDRCIRQLQEWRRTPRLHPLTRHAIDYQLALNLRIRGKRAEALKLSGALGFLPLWEMEAIDGETVLLAAEPITGQVNSPDFLELAPGRRHHLRARVSAPAGMRVALRVGGEMLEQVCVNGACVDVPRSRRVFFDAHAVPLELQKGENALELVFSSEASALRVAARLTRPDGRLLAFTNPPDRATYQLSSSAAGRLVDPPASARGAAAALVADAPGKPETVLAACQLAALSGDPDTGALSALSADPAGGATDFLLQLYRCREGRRGALQLVRRLEELAPHDPSVLLAAASYRVRAGHSFDAWVKLRALCPGSDQLSCLDEDDYTEAVLLLREVYRTLGLVLSQETLLTEALKRTGGRRADIVAALAEVLVEGERYVEAEAVLGQYLSRWPGEYSLAATRMFVLEKMSQLEKALQLVEQMVWLNPTNTYLAFTLADLHHLLGNDDRAQELFGPLETRGWHNPFLLNEIANFHFRAGNEEKALAAWKRVLVLRPHDTEIKQLVAHLSAHGAENIVPGDEEIRDLAAAFEAGGGARFVGVLDRTEIGLYDSRAWRLQRVQAVKALSPPSAYPYRIGVTYDSHLEEVTFLKMVVLRADGTVSPVGDYGDVSLSEEQYNLYYDLRTAYVEFKDLQPDDIMLVAYEVESAASGLSSPFAGILWPQGRIPRYNTSVTISVPTTVDLFYHQGRGQSKLTHEYTRDETDTQVRHIFEYGPITAVEDEPFPPGRFEYAAHLHYSTMEDWEQFANWYASVAYGETAVDDDMRRLVEESRQRYQGRELVEALCRHVADEIRYVGLELGVHGLKPYAPADVFHRGFGDCKDKSLLLVTLLKEAGVDAKVVVLATASLGRPELLPGSQSVFDHAIVHIPGENVYFDPTARYLGLDQLPWQDQGAQALIIDPGAPQKVVLPESTFGDNLVEVEAEVTGGDELGVSGTLRFTGQFAWWVHRALEQRASWKTTVESYVSSLLPAVALDEVSEEVVTGASPAVVVKFSGRWAPRERGRVALLKHVETSASVVSLPQRETPVVFAYPYRHHYRLHFAPGTVSVGAEFARESEAEGARFSVTAGASGPGTSVEVEFVQVERRISTDSYEQFRDLVLEYQQALTALEVTIAE